MTMPLADYVIARLRQCVPADGYVVPGSTPVLSFGSATEAVVATVGLNPSRMEFLDRNGGELTGTSRRFETLASLGVSNLTAATELVLRRIVQACDGYFGANPYTRWFDQLEPVLQSVGASYYDGSACHLDLVQWATDPVWSKIPNRRTRERLLAEDAGFLRHQLAHGPFKLVLINGSGVAKHFEAVMGISLRAVPGVAGSSTASRLSVGELPTAKVVAWSVNVQSSHGVCNMLRARLAERVAELSHDGAHA